MTETVAGGNGADGLGEPDVSLSPAAGGQQWRFIIPVATPSVNSLNQIIYSQRKVEMKPEVRQWRSKVSGYIPRIALNSKESFIRIDALFCYPFYHRNGTLRVLDTQNMMKALIDTIAWKVGFNDLRVKCGSWDSADDTVERVAVTLTEVG